MDSGNNQQPERWHVGRTIDLGHILTTLCLVVAVSFFLNDFDDRVDKLEYRADMTDKAIRAEHEYVKSVFDQIREDLRYIRDRLDKEKR